MSAFKDVDQLTASLTRAQITNQPSRLLYVDVLNYSDSFFPLNDWSVTRAFSRVKDFVEAAVRTNLILTVFIDDTTPSGESDTKWTTRREKEITKGERNMPPGLSRMLGEMFSALGVDVFYSDEADCDTTIASFAHSDNANILSNDKDLLRYTGASFTQYGKYEISRDKRLVLIPKEHPSRRPRPIPIPPAKPKIRRSCLHIDNGVYKRGVVTPLVRALNIDVHGILIPLLLTSFAKKGLIGRINLKWPLWDASSNGVRWYNEEVSVPPITALNEQLYADPDRAVLHFFPSLRKPEGVSSRDWKKHLFGIRSLVYDICSSADNPMFQMWIRYESPGGKAAASSGTVTSHHRTQPPVNATAKHESVPKPVKPPKPPKTVSSTRPDSATQPPKPSGDHGEVYTTQTKSVHRGGSRKESCSLN